MSPTNLTRRDRFSFWHRIRLLWHGNPVPEGVGLASHAYSVTEGGDSDRRGTAGPGGTDLPPRGCAVDDVVRALLGH